MFLFGKRDEGTSPIPAARVDKIDTILGKSVEFKGDIKSQGIVKIEGKFEGDIQSSQDVIISQSGNVNASMKARHAAISGEFNGNIILEGRLEIRSTGKVIGDVKVSSLVVEEQAVFDGKCEMNRQIKEKKAELEPAENKTEAKGIPQKGA